MLVMSSDDVEVAVHDLGGGHAALQALLVAHATGFHGRAYLPLAAALADRFHTVAFDFRGHGDTAQPMGVPVDWNRYADDAEAVARSLTRPLVGFGHSMGAACLLIVAHRHPDLFSGLVVYEPVVFPPDHHDVREGPTRLIEGARRRRSAFASYADAKANYATKPPLSTFAPAALEAFVRHGFRQGDDGQLHLKCRPELEAATFEMARAHPAWDVLPEIAIPVTVISGRPEPDAVSQAALPVAQRLPNSRYVELAELDHFGPMTHPELVAELIIDALAD